MNPHEQGSLPLEEEPVSEELLDVFESDDDFIPTEGTEEVAQDERLAKIIKTLQALPQEERDQVLANLDSTSTDITFEEPVVDAIYTCGLCGSTHETTKMVKRRFKGVGQPAPMAKPAKYTTRTCEKCGDFLTNSLHESVNGKDDPDIEDELNKHHQFIINYINSMGGFPHRIMRTS